MCIRCVPIFWLRKGDIEQAIETNKILTQKKPDFVEGHMALGTLLDQTGDLIGAEKAYSKALELDPEFVAAANNLAWLKATGPNADLSEALRLALKAKEFSPDDPYIADTLGWIHYKRGAYKLALTQFSMATEKRPDLAAMRYHLALALYADGQIDPAKSELTKCLEMKNFPEHDDAAKLLNKISSTS